MDRVIGGFAGVDDGDLVLCRDDGVAYQRDMTVTASYNGEYFAKCAGYEGQEIALKINAGRVALVNDHAGAAARVLDVGIGSGEFIRNRPNTFGYDINPTAIEWLKGHDRWSEDFAHFKAFTFWDVLEHVPEPQQYLDRIALGSFLFTCLPIFDDLTRIRESKHYRPGEHLYYWTQDGFLQWMARYNFELLKIQTFETQAGRDSITSFAFKRQ